MKCLAFEVVQVTWFCFFLKKCLKNQTKKKKNQVLWCLQSDYHVFFFSIQIKKSLLSIFILIWIGFCVILYLPYQFKCLLKSFLVFWKRKKMLGIRNKKLNAIKRIQKDVSKLIKIILTIFFFFLSKVFLSLLPFGFITWILN